MADNSYDVTKLVLLEALKASAQRAKTAVNAVDVKATAAIKSANVVNNAIKLYTSTDCTGTPSFSIDFPAELVLDGVNTDVVDSFEWSAQKYPGSTDPDLDGKMVLIIAIKTTTASGTTTIDYHFKDLQSLIKPYTNADASITINGHTVAVRISQAANNAIELKSDGLHVDISGKADKDTDAVVGNVAAFDANGNPIDSGHAIATNTEVTAMLDEVWGANS